ncbi:MAG TPA: farnesyl diphosphate synthase [Gemmatimonadaceae bacterium]
MSEDKGQQSAHRAHVESAIGQVVSSELGILAEPVRSAVSYALSNGGKRMRGMLVLAAYKAAGGVHDASGLAASVEIIHAYSLVHDDLPCMDDDDMRRGRPSTHREFSVPVAAAAGAAMIPLAARVALKSARSLRLPAGAGCTIVKVLMQGAGAGGMIGGQYLDLAAERLELSRDQLDGIHRSKTGALIRASVRVGGIAAGATDSRLDALAAYGDSIGLAFQIMDDVLDVTSSTARLGKTAGRDAELGKSTYPALLGVEGAVKRAASLVEEGCGSLRKERLLTAELERLADFIVSRSH